MKSKVLLELCFEIKKKDRNEGTELVTETFNYNLGDNETTFFIKNLSEGNSIEHQGEKYYLDKRNSGYQIVENDFKFLGSEGNEISNQLSYFMYLTKI